jgi:hypothetical protein
MTEAEFIRLYVHLKESEAILDAEVFQVLRRIESVVFTHMTISEVEELTKRAEDKTGGPE